jgi:UDP-GlcNAc:undecaprenyl-phosphate GlcNAc-1-phosphate transferase
MHSIIFSIVILASSAFLAIWLTIPFSIWLAGRVGAIDMPGKYKIHARPIPRLGGLGILLAFGLILSALLLAMDISITIYQQVIVLLILLIGVAAIGFLDDVRGVREWIKFVWEGIMAIILISLVDGESWWVAVIAWFWIVGLINGYNFLDGMDGLAASAAAIHLLALAAMYIISGNGFLAIVAGALATATLGFLRYNWPPATIFMGDIGSLSLGFVISGLSLLLVVNENFSFKAILALILAASLPLGDVSLTFLRRLVNRKPLFPADRGHSYDQMVDRGGLSKLKAVRVSMLTAVAVGGLGLIIFTLPLPLAIGLFVLSGVLLLGAARYFKISLRWET